MDRRLERFWDKYKRNSEFGKQKRTDMLPKTLDQYFESRLHEESDQIKHALPNISYTTASETEEAKREIACLDTELVMERAKWMEDKKRLDERWKACHDRYNDLYASIPTFNVFYLDSFVKREKIMERYFQEKRNTEFQEREIRRFKKQAVLLQKLKERYDKRLQKFEPFRGYMAQLKASSQDRFPDLYDAITKYEKLVEERREREQRNDEADEYLERKDEWQAREANWKATEILAYRNFLTDLAEYRIELEDDAMNLQDNLLRIQTTAAQRTKIIGQIKMSIDNLYKAVCRYMHRASKIDPHDPLGQLEDIMLSSKELNKLNKDIKHLQKSAQNAAEAERQAQKVEEKREEERVKRMERFMKKGLDLRGLFQLAPLRPNEHHSVKPSRTEDDVHVGGTFKLLHPH